MTGNRAKEYWDSHSFPPKLCRAGELVAVILLLAGFANAPTTGTKSPAIEPDIKAAQQALAKLGFDPGAINGTWNPATAKALTAFQRANGFTATGKLNAGLSEALILAAAGAQRKGMTFDLRIGKTLIGDEGWRVYYGPDGRKTMKLRDGRKLHGRWWRKDGTHCEYSFGHKRDVCGDFFTDNYVVFFLNGKWTYFDRSGKKEWGIRLVDGRQF
ncbi:MAG: peptidoglycan-binding protein [Hyphomicrobiaceae bacterium]|nr:peptidoglycan-binding protein [Hyphomicrobiaceae bacterium]